MNKQINTYLELLNKEISFYDKQFDNHLVDTTDPVQGFYELISLLLKEKSKAYTNHETYPQWYTFNNGYYQLYGQFIVECHDQNKEFITQFIMHNYHFVLDELLIKMFHHVDSEESVLEAVGKIAAMQDILKYHDIHDEPTRMLSSYECLPYNIYKKYGIVFATIPQMKSFDITTM